MLWGELLDTVLGASQRDLVMGWMRSSRGAEWDVHGRATCMHRQEEGTSSSSEQEQATAEPKTWATA